MSTIQKVFMLIVAIFVLSLITWAVITVHEDGCKTTVPGYFVGTIIDKGESCGKSTYRWVIADWWTIDDKHLGIEEINAAGLPINRLSVGDTIRVERVLFLPGVFWFKVAAGTAYTPKTIPIFVFVIALIAQIFAWVFVIWSFFKIYFFFSPEKETA